MKIWMPAIFGCLFITVITNAQTTDTANTVTSKESYDMYMKKRRTAKTFGWILLGSGVIMGSASYLSYANNGFNGVWKNEHLVIAGGVMAIASIPLFITASHFKRKAMLALKEEKLGAGKYPANPYFPALAIQISL